MKPPIFFRVICAVARPFLGGSRAELNYVTCNVPSPKAQAFSRHPAQWACQMHESSASLQRDNDFDQRVKREDHRLGTPQRVDAQLHHLQRGGFLVPHPRAAGRSTGLKNGEETETAPGITLHWIPWIALWYITPIIMPSPFQQSEFQICYFHNLVCKCVLRLPC